MYMQTVGPVRCMMGNETVGKEDETKNRKRIRISVVSV